jgi:hypothetical protein
MPRRRYAAALVSVLSRSALPYGYTISVWTSGEVLKHDLGSPDVVEIWLFLAGAVAAFSALGVLATLARPRPAKPSPYQLLRAGTTQALAVGGALGATCAIGLIHAVGAWPLASFAATGVYLAIASLEVRELSESEP